MKEYIIIIIAALTLITLIGIAIKYKKKKAIQQKYNGKNSLQHAPQLLSELVANQFLIVKDQMNGATIEAITECDNIVATGTTHQCKNAHQKACYLVLSGNDIHFMHFEGGVNQNHLILDRSSLMNTRIADTNRTHEEEPAKLRVDIENEPLDILYYAAIRKNPEQYVISKPSFEVQAQYRLMGRYFKEKLAEKYPHLSS